MSRRKRKQEERRRLTRILDAQIVERAHELQRSKRGDWVPWTSLETGEQTRRQALIMRAVRSYHRSYPRVLRIEVGETRTVDDVRSEA